MSIVWGAYSTNKDVNGAVTNTRVGLDVHTDAIGAGTTAVNVYVDVYVGSNNYDYGDNQHIQLSGSVSAGFDFFNDLPRAVNAQKYVGTYTIANQGLSPGGGPTYSFHAQLSGSFNGATPFVDTSYTLPALPVRVSSAPGAPGYANTSGTQTDIGFGLPADQGGQFPDYTWVQVGLANFGSLVYDNQSPGWNGRVLTGLMPNTDYFARVASHNAAGWSPWSPVSSFRTGPYVINTPPEVSAIGQHGATLTWARPSLSIFTSDVDPVVPAWVHMQVATDDQFTGVVQEFGAPSLQAWRTSLLLTGLTPGIKYYARVRASGGNNWGLWSLPAEFRTLSGIKMKDPNGNLVDIVPWGRVNGIWQPAVANKRVAEAWVI